MKYTKNIKNTKREEILSTFSQEEIKTLCEKVFSFSGLDAEGAEYLRLINRSNVKIPERPAEEKVAGKIWDKELTQKALLGAGVGAGLGGIYGAFKKHKNKKDKIKDMLKYGLLGAGLGGVGGGLAGAYSYKQTNPESMGKLYDKATDVTDSHQIAQVEKAVAKNNELAKLIIADAESKDNDYSRIAAAKAINKSGMLFNDPQATFFVSKWKNETPGLMDSAGRGVDYIKNKTGEASNALVEGFKNLF